VSFAFRGAKSKAAGAPLEIIVPEEGLRDVKLTAIPGVPPNLKNPPKGCRFAERCKYVKRECTVFSVPLQKLEGDRVYRCILSEEELRRLYAREAEKNE
jgi:peptide/nickel transport system ATP-binding protein